MHSEQGNRFFFSAVQELRIGINDGNESIEKMFIESIDLFHRLVCGIIVYRFSICFNVFLLGTSGSS